MPEPTTAVLKPEQPLAQLKDLNRVLDRLAQGEALSASQAERAIGTVLSLAATEPAALEQQGPIAQLLTRLAARPLGAEELVGAATALRARMLVVPGGQAALCPCGTGGSGKATFSTSTAVAFVLNGLGVLVAKHGNRSASGRCGSADTLDNLGVRLDLTTSSAAQRLADHGLVFLFAPRFHPALGPLAPLRRALGFPTVFNAIGPLCNPAGVQHQVLGVAGPARVEATAMALSRLGTRRSAVVSGECGLDEISLCGPSRLAWVHGQQLEVATVTPADFGLPLWSEHDVSGGSVTQNVTTLLGILAGHASPHADLVCANAAVALIMLGRADSLRTGAQMARAALQDGRAARALQRARQEVQ